ncbi:MAG TPA: hypothetical protein PL118_01965 [Rectinema sp.]|jgi:hypothetical protein|nr:hypothetical protein [Spirochaetia bacterium]HNP93531.1 hypothetical protein [Rectinema sp.]HNT60192.1 hypothetical protein [Rectinema sp.]HNV36825.1 hypothetical protein [Rectinema sp.]HOH17396.1 hypothetical protein [Rectinema sp.]
MNTVYLSKDLAMERVSSFLSRWKNSTDQDIDFDLAKSSEIIEDASELLRKVPREVQKIGCYCLASQRKVVVWLLTDESGHGSGDEERGQDFLQIVLQKPPEFGSVPVEIKYNVMSNSADRNNNVCLCGIEISYGNILILSPPATGEMVISISRIELAKELS